jgi:replication-associated recombination protein RarA
MNNKPLAQKLAPNNLKEVIGQKHLIGKDKYYHIDRVKAYILALDSALYYKTKKVIEKYKKIIS